MGHRRASRWWLYARDHPLTLCIALGALLGGTVLTASPHLLTHVSVGRALPGETPGRLWAMAFAGSGILVLYGIVKLDARFEQLGLLLLSACYSTVVYSVLHNTGWNGGFVSIITAGAVAVGLACRATSLRFAQPPRQH